jgi:hypothetical protein
MDEITSIRYQKGRKLVIFKKLLLSVILTLYSAYTKRLGVRSISWYTLLFQMCVYDGKGRGGGRGEEIGGNVTFRSVHLTPRLFPKGMRPVAQLDVLKLV